MKVRIAVLLGGPIKNDYRVIKTIKSLTKIGYIDLFYINSTQSDDRSIFDEHVKLFPKEIQSSFRLKFIRNSFFSYEFMHFKNDVLSKNKAYDYIWSNDLPTLLPAVKIAKKLGAKLIFDSHEIYIETLNQFFPKKAPFLKSIMYNSALTIMRLHGNWVERRLVPKANFFITVNESLLDFFKEKYALSNPRIVMNYPQQNNQTILPVNYRSMFNWNSDDCILLYQGGLNEGRGLMKLLECVKVVSNNFKLVIIGEGMIRPNMELFVKNNQLTERIKFIDFQPLDSLINYTKGADVGVNLLEPINLSKKYASPNKLYEYIQAEIPVLASNTIENNKVLDRFEIGIKCENNKHSITEAIKELTFDKINALKASCQKISSIFTWSHQETAILSIFNSEIKHSEKLVECKKCLLNNQNYPTIKFNDEQVCETCEQNESLIAEHVKDLVPLFKEQQLAKIRKLKKGKYDCLIGISGGSDSSYLVYLAQQWGLNPLLLHIDGGWNNEYAVQNIKQLVNNSGFDFVTVVLPWHEIQDLQQAFIQANVLDIDLPFDNLMVYYNYKIAKENNIKTVFNGYNAVTEGLLPEAFTHFKYDKKNILDIHRKFGKINKLTLEFLGPFEYFRFEKINRIHFTYPLNWLDYDSEKVKLLLSEKYNWKDYHQKHHDNFYTKFYQEHILPKKFNIDKSIAHLSMLILNNKLSKDEALQRYQLLKKIAPQQYQKDKEYFIKKLDLNETEFSQYMQIKPTNHRFYKSDLDLYDKLGPFYRILKRIFKFSWF